MLTSRPQGHDFGVQLGSVSDEVRVRRFSLVEGLNGVSRAEVELVSRAPDLAFDDVMDQAGSLVIRDRSGAERSFMGLVSGFAQGDSGHHWTAYRAIIEPPLHRLERV